MNKSFLSVLSGIIFSIILILNLLVITEARATAPYYGEGSWACEHCNHAGGPGATSCSCRIEILKVASECSVEVSAGYYACCRTTWLDRCNCFSCKNQE